MKKVFGMILAVMISITSVMFGFSWLKINDKTASATTALTSFSETALQNKVDILDPNHYYAEYSSQQKQNQAPFDEETEKMMTGYSFFPEENNLKEVNSNYYFDGFTLSSNESIFIWIFIPNEYTYTLKLTFETSDGDYISWTLERSYLYSLLNAEPVEIIFGWRLFEFCVSDAEKLNAEDNDLSSMRFIKMNIAYETELESAIQSNNNKFAFYHVYRATSFSNSSTIVDLQEYSNFKIKDDFINEYYFIDDQIYFTNVQDIFEYLFVGQFNLLEYSSSDYSLDITLIDSDGEEYNKTFGEKFVFENYGTHRLNLTLYEYRNSGSAIVMFTQLSFNIENFILGSFTNVGYKVDKSETKMITFKISPYFEIVENSIVVKIKDKNKASVTYYVEGDICYIQITGLKKGETKISVEAQGGKVGAYEPKTYLCSTEVEITDENKKSSEEVFLWVIFGICGTGFAIFVVISLVKSRYVGVK